MREIGIGFLFAPALHGAMKHAIGPRREIGIRTIFNILGPLTNPAGAECQVMGVYSEQLVEKLAHVLHKLGCRKGFVVHGMDGMDEVTLTAATSVAEVTPAGVRISLFTPEELGFDFCTMEELRGGNAEENAVIVKGVLSGDPGASPGHCAAECRFWPGCRREDSYLEGWRDAGRRGDRFGPGAAAASEAG